MEILRVSNSGQSIQFIIGSPIKPGATVVLWELGIVGARALTLLAELRLNGKSFLLLYDEATDCVYDDAGRVVFGRAQFHRLEIESDWRSQVHKSIDYFADESGNVYERLARRDANGEDAFRRKPSLLLKMIQQDSRLLNMVRQLDVKH